MTELTQSDLHELMAYDKETGIFMWKKARRGVPLDKPLGTCNGNGYLRITVCGKSYYAHRLAWMYEHGEWPEQEIDHINGITTDNRIANLRSVTSIENAQNKRKATGVSWHKKAQKWQVHVCIRKVRQYLGLFDSFDNARNEYLKAKEFANVCL